MEFTVEFESMLGDSGIDLVEIRAHTAFEDRRSEEAGPVSRQCSS